MDILIDNTPLEVTGVQTEIDLAVTGFDTDTVAKAYKTNRIDVPGTPANRAALTRLHELNAGGYTAPLATVRGNGVQFTGSIKLYPARTANGQSVMPLQVISGNGDWVKELVGERLQDTDMTPFEHTFNVSTVLASEIAAYVGDVNYLYDVCDRGDGLIQGELMLPERFPAVRLSALLVQIFKEKGIKVTSNTLSDGYFNKLFMLFSRTNDLQTVDKWSQEMFLANGLPTPYNAAAPIGTSQFGGVTWYTPTPGIEITQLFTANWQNEAVNDGDHYTPAVGQYLVDSNQEVGTKLKGALRYKIERSDVTTYFAFYTRIQIRQGSPTGTIVAQSDEKFSPSPTQYYTQTVETDWFRPTSGQSYYMALQYRGVLNSGAKIKAVIDTTSTDNYFRSYVYNWFVTGDTVTYERILPDVTKSEFISQVAKAFDLLFDYQPDTRTLRIESRGKFYDEIYRTFPGSVAGDAAIEVDPYVEDVGKSLLFSTKEDGSDKTPGAMAIAEPYQVDINNIYTLLSKSTAFELFWSDTVLTQQSRLVSGAAKIPTLWKDGAPTITDGVQEFSKFSTEFNTRLLYYVGRRGYSYKYDGQIRYALPLMERVTASDIVTRYWSDRLWQLRNGKRVKVSALLPGTTVNRWINGQYGYSLRTPIQLTIPRTVEGMFMLESVAGYRMDSRGLCDVTLIELPPRRREPAVGTDPYQQFTLINGGALSINDAGSQLSQTTPGEIIIPDDIPE